MAMFRFKPLVFVSSSIASLLDERRHIKAAIEATGLADAWLFEFHATAAGDAPEAQYLAQARACDVFVLVIADSVSRATWEEYQQAYDDNPLKILPFLVGDQSGEALTKREVLSSRHTYKLISSGTELGKDVAAAIEQSVGRGTLVLDELDRLVLDRIGQIRSLLDLPGGLELPLQSSGPDAVGIVEALECAPQALVTGPAGSGKTYALLQRLRDRQNRQQLPVYVRISGDGSTAVDQIAAAVRPARFDPGRDLVHRWAADGCLCIGFDGLDELAEDEREAALAAISDFADQYPRCAVMVAIRTITGQSLSRLSRVPIAELTDDAVLELLRTVGYSISNAWELPDRFREFLHRPLWAGLLASAGPSVSSVVELLGGVVRSRLERTLPNEPIAGAALQSGLSVIALADQAKAGQTIQSALGSIAAWDVLELTRAKYGRRPADWYVENGLKSGLIGREGERLAFVHPLISSFLAAAALVESPGLATTSALSRDGRVFLAVLLGEERASEVMAALEACDVFGLASVSRVAAPAKRGGSIERDIARFDEALDALAPAAGEQAARTLHAQRTAVCRSGQFVAMRRVAPEAASVAESDDLTAWASPSEEPVTYTCWMPDPFTTATPELLAAAEIVAVFKKRVMELRPSGSPWAPHDLNIEALLADRDALSGRLLSFVTRERHFRVAALSELGLGTHPLATMWTGNPHVTVMLRDGHAPTFFVRWDSETEGVEYVMSDATPRGSWLGTVLADPEAVAYHDLERELEDLLESGINSQAPARPSRFPEWIV